MVGLICWFWFYGPTLIGTDTWWPFRITAYEMSFLFLSSKVEEGGTPPDVHSSQVPIHAYKGYRI